MILTKKMLEDAISTFLGEKENEAMRLASICLPTRHGTAIIEAFMNGGHEDEAEVLREAGRRLHKNGYYEWDEE